jgi:D-serine deaminase-like pyridoxal phosphate-dependent protein
MEMHMRTSILAVATVAGTAACLVAVPSSSASGVPSCGDASLTVTATAEQGATGHANFVLRFKNHTTHSCSLYGYPGLDALNASGHVLAHARRTLSGFTGGSRHGLQTVIVRPGGYASADVEWMNFNAATGGSCRFSRSVAATPANTGHTAHLARSVSVCSLQVHPTVAGRTGNG